MKYAFISTELANYALVQLCRALEVSRSGYAVWRSRTASRRAVADGLLLELIGAVRQGRRRVYGSNVEAWVADLTQLATASGPLFLAVVLDLRTRRVLGFCCARTPSGAMALQALSLALATGCHTPGLLHHSDRGGHYVAKQYRELLASAGLVQSLSGHGNCWDNAVMESFFASLKREITIDLTQLSATAAAAELADHIDFYNSQRIHSTLGNQTPEDYATVISSYSSVH